MKVVPDPEIAWFVAELLPRLRDEWRAQHVLLHGSRVRGDAETWSDLDVIVVSEAFHRTAPLHRLPMVPRSAGGDTRVEMFCYTPAEFAEKRREPGMVATACREGIWLRPEDGGEWVAYVHDADGPHAPAKSAFAALRPTDGVSLRLVTRTMTHTPDGESTEVPKPTPEQIQRWVERAQRDWDNAQRNAAVGVYDLAAFLCQQAVEKMLKAAHLAVRQAEAERTHDIAKLLKGLDAPAELAALAGDMTDDYFATRYPDALTPRPLEAYDQELGEDRLRRAEQIMAWARERIEAATQDTGP
jgi:HEPN domain-containing protein